MKAGHGMGATNGRARRALAGIVLGAAAAGVGVWLGSAAASTALPLKPIATLGTIRPAPPPGRLGPEGVPIPPHSAALLAATGSKATLTKSVDGIKCQPSEKVLFHIHAHLTVFVNGKARVIPYGIGIGPPLSGENTSLGPFVTSGSCFSWLHTHAQDGIIHIESPIERTYTLGDLFDVWGQPLSRGRVGPVHGHVVALFNGQVYTGDPRGIPLLRHAQIQLDVGRPLIAPVRITAWKAL